MDDVRYMISDASRIVQVEAHVLRYWEEELSLNVGRTELGHRYYTEKNIHEFMNIKELKERGLQLKAIKVLLPELGNKEHRSLEDAYESYAVLGEDEEYRGSENPGKESDGEQQAWGRQDNKTGDMQDNETGDVQDNEAGDMQDNKTGDMQDNEAPGMLDKESGDMQDNAPEDMQDNAPRDMQDNGPALQKSEVTSLAELDAQTQKLWQFEHIAINAFKQALKENNRELEADISDAIVREMDILMKLKEEREEERYRRLDESIRAHQILSPHRMTASAKERRSGGFWWFKRHYK